MAQTESVVNWPGKIKDFSFVVSKSEDERAGRCARAAEDVPCGTTVSATLPYAATLMPEYMNRRCSRCFSILRSSLASMAPVPLKKCSACGIVAYCDRDCQKKDWKLHKHQCSHLKILPKAIQLIAEIGDVVDFDADQSYMDAVLISRTFWKKHAAKTDDDKLEYVSVEQMQEGKRRPYEALFAKIVFSLEGFLPPDVSEDQVMLMLSKFPVNNFAIVDDLQKAIGAGVYPIGCILNHSCRPNCILVYDGTRQIIRTVRNVSKDEELCHSYVDLITTRDERREQLLTTYEFECTCERCEEENPTSDSLGAAMDLRKVQRLEGFPIEVQNKLKNAYELHQKALSEEDLSLERALVKSIQDIRTEVLDHYNLELHQTRCWAMSLALLDNDIEFAANVCREIVLTLEGLLKPVMPMHPVLSTQMFTLAELETANGNKYEAKKVLSQCIKYVRITHGEESQLYKKAMLFLLSLN